MKIKERLKQIRDYIYDSSVDLKDRSFVVFSFVMIGELILGAIPSGILMGEPLSSTLSTFAGALFFLAYVTVAIKTKKIASARIILSLILIFIFLPAMFFTNGGVYSGVPVSLLLGGLYINMILGGVWQTVMNILFSVSMIVCWIIGYYNPELITEYSRKDAFVDSIMGLIIVNLVICILMTFHSKLYNKENETAKRQSKELEELNRSQNRFFSSMSHEIRTPINTVLGMNELILRQEDASEEIKKDARNIQGAGKLLLALINDILDMSKIEAGKMDIVPVNYSVSALLSEIVNMIWLKAEEKGLKFNVDIDPGVPETLYGDEVRIKQILINLLNNAVKYTKEGAVNLHMECELGESGDALLKITVSDTGMGIKPEAIPHLFDTFQRVDEEKNRHIEGTGLGLSIVKQLVELMDGEITVNSVYGEGSAFSVSVKQGVSSDKKIGDLKITGSGSIGISDKFEHSFHAPAAKLLIVDDNEMNLQVEKKLLYGTEMTVDLALSGQSALEQTLITHYDVIFMDHLMPEMDGIECYERIRTQKGGMNLNTPIVVLTANAGGENLELYNNTGFDGYLVKPVSGRQLEDMLLSKLPVEKVSRLGDNEMTGSSMNTASGYSKKRAVAVATGSMSDLPARVRNELQIGILPSNVYTDEGIFRDNVDIDSEELIRYMGNDLKPVSSDAPSEEEYVHFFAQALKKAHHLIYITLTAGSSNEYSRALSASKVFENVTVINSECLSSATGILAMFAAHLAKQNLPVDRIVAEIEEAKKRINCSFVIRSTDVMARRKRISPLMNSILNTLWLRPMLNVKNDHLGVGRFFFGSERRCYEKYIKYALPIKVRPDKSFVFVTYVGMDEEDLLWIEEKVRERVEFKNIIFQKSSAGIATNCGAGTFGLLYLTESELNRNMGAFFEHRSDETDSLDEIETVETTVKETEEEPREEAKEEPEASEESGYPEGIDSATGIKNSGSKEAFDSVLKMFYDSYKAKAEEIKKYYESGDWENYTIKVHALKSSSRLVGALKLGDDAEALEMAGKSSDIEFITSHNEALMTSYKAIADGLSKLYGAGEDLPDIPGEMLADAYGGLSEFVGSKDYELARMVTDSLKEYKLPKEDAERFEKIEICLSRMDWDGIMELLHEVG